MSEEKTFLRAFEFHATVPTQGQPYKPHGDGSGVILFACDEHNFELVPEMQRFGRGKHLRILVEVSEPETYGA